MHGGDHLAHLICRPGSGASLRPVQVELDQIRAVVQLTKSRGQQAVGVSDLNRQPGGPRARFGEPGPGSPDVRVLIATAPAVSQTERERAIAPVAGIRAPRRADIPDPADASADEGGGVLLRCLDQVGRRIAAAGDPLSAALQRQVAMAVDESRHDRRPARVNHLARQASGPRAVAVVIKDPGDHAAINRYSDRPAQRRTEPVSERSALIEGWLSRHPGQVSILVGSNSAAPPTMKSRLGATSLPISRSNISAAKAASPILIRRRVRRRGSIVVSASCEASISPRPLYRCGGSSYFSFLRSSSRVFLWSSASV